MEIVNLIQGSQDWLEWREDRITASDAAIILRLNKYTSPIKLWEEKMRLIPSKIPNDHMLRGQLLEPIARQLFIQETGLFVEPTVAQHSDLFWMGASLDGIDKSKTLIVEIKCPMIGGYTNSLMFGEIPPMYKAQMQHQLCVTGAHMCFYVTYNEQHEQKINIIEVARDESFIQHMVASEQAFYKEFICGFKRPPQNWQYKEAA